MAGTRTHLEVAEAITRVTAAIHRLHTERVSRTAAHGRVLARAVTSRVALPPWRNAAMDGYAVRAVDIGATPAILPVRSEEPRLNSSHRT